jgi:hypothetical protein
LIPGFRVHKFEIGSGGEGSASFGGGEKFPGWLAASVLENLQEILPSSLKQLIIYRDS